jgi:exosortase/archaeosortase family protein
MTAVPDVPGSSAVRVRRAAGGRGPAGSAIRVALLIAIVGGVFSVAQTGVRHQEALAVAGGVRSLGFHGVLAVQSSEILLAPGSGPLFWVDITPSCSSLGPALAIALITTLISVGRPASDRLLAGGAGVLSIVAGNFTRIGSSVIVGLLAGRPSLVLFHNWVGSMFGFAYTIGGFVVALSILLHRRLPHRAEP